MQFTTFSAIAFVASAMAMMTNQAKAAPAVRDCAEADTYGNFNVEHPPTLKYGDKITVTFTRNCRSVADYYPQYLTLDIGDTQPVPEPLYQVNGPKKMDSHKVGTLLEYTTTFPDIDLSGFYKGDNLTFVATTQFFTKGPHGGKVDSLRTFQQGFTFNRTSE
ncbi:uncharacterized protein FA14DRAFT_173028 [Meira miltonrushii]|uniref:Uncharacterized protein n=1 Tax=Meira miltonrushii TaxID=1280837 RepID=A0A316V6I0_9BASI|nr:uncharacterized protein FA14DRAFT_173028 [Meira miltonrushii]PWN33197.1 hypothetical protein FA14DRAFT_173028 [Meira miltonrushii]